MRVLLITSSARGHAIAEALARSPQQPEIIAVSPQRNPGIRALAKQQHVADIMDFDAVTAIAKQYDFDFAFIGPDDPIGMGLADALEDIGIPTIAPKKSLARIEASKGFTRNLMEKHGIDASPQYRVFTSNDQTDLEAYITNDLGGNYVVKYDALKGGKGVKVSGEHLQTVAEGVVYAEECIAECGQVVIEEKLIGVEFSLISFVSGTNVVHTPAVQDHKRAHEGDTGPNTGGMGTYSDTNHSLPFLTNADLERAKEINQLVAEALLAECGEPYRGILYGGFIATARGVQVIEYNARFGDPEALNILPLLESDFVAMCQAMIDGTLSDDHVQWSPLATVCKYITPASYPEAKDQRGEVMTLPNIPDNARLYYGDLNQADDGTLKIGGSRTVGIVGLGENIAEAEQIAQQLCEQVGGPVRFRSDIGTEATLAKRITMMQALRTDA